MSLRGCLGMALVSAIVGIAGYAHAHLGHVVTRAERYLKIQVAGDHVRLVVSLTLAPSEARRLVTARGEDSLSDQAAASHLEAWIASFDEELRVELDGNAVPVAWDTGYMSRAGRDGRAPLTVEAVGRVEHDGGAHELVLIDSMQPRIFDRTDVAIQDLDEASIESVALDGDVRPSVRAFAFGKERETARIGITFRSDEATAFSRPASPYAAIAAAAATLLVFAAILLVTRRRRRRP